jgi:xylulokinase
MTPAVLARAAIEGLLCGLADGIDALTEAGVEVRRVLLIGGAARSDAVRRIAPLVFGVPVAVPEPSEYVADGAARQAAWVVSGAAEPPSWRIGTTETYEGSPDPSVRARYAEVRDLVASRR